MLHYARRCIRYKTATLDIQQCLGKVGGVWSVILPLLLGTLVKTGIAITWQVGSYGTLSMELFSDLLPHSCVILFD